MFLLDSSVQLKSCQLQQVPHLNVKIDQEALDSLPDVDGNVSDQIKTAEEDDLFKGNESEEEEHPQDDDRGAMELLQSLCCFGECA